MAGSTDGDEMLLKIGAGLIVLGFALQMFSGYTYTVASPEECPET